MGPPTRPPVLVATQFRLRNARRIIEETVGGELGVAVEFEDAAPERVAAGGRHHADDAGAASGVRAGHRSGNREFRDAVGRRPVRKEIKRVRPDKVVLDGDAVERDRFPCRATAVDRCRRAIGDAGDSRLELDEIRHVAAEQRNVEDLLLTHRCSHFRHRRRHRLLASRHLNDLGELSNGKLPASGTAGRRLRLRRCRFAS